jgi:hypothetical protein
LETPSISPYQNAATPIKAKYAGLTKQLLRSGAFGIRCLSRLHAAELRRQFRRALERVREFFREIAAVYPGVRQTGYIH